MPTILPRSLAGLIPCEVGRTRRLRRRGHLSEPGQWRSRMLSAVFVAAFR